MGKKESDGWLDGRTGGSRVDPHISASLAGDNSKDASTVKSDMAMQSPASSQPLHDVTSWAVVAISMPIY